MRKIIILGGEMITLAISTALAQKGFNIINSTLSEEIEKERKRENISSSIFRLTSNDITNNIPDISFIDQMDNGIDPESRRYKSNRNNKSNRNRK